MEQIDGKLPSVKRKLYYVSDIHLEMRSSKIGDNLTITPEENDDSIVNYLALCGDIGNPFMSNYKMFLCKHALIFDHIFIITGNHEYYSKNRQRTMDEVDQKIREIVNQFDNVTFLETNKPFQIDEILFVGCTLWTEVDELSEIVMNDYNRTFVLDDRELPESNQMKNTFRTVKQYIKPGRRLIRHFDILDKHNEMKDYISRMINMNNVLFEELDKTTMQKIIQKIIVLTHHAPSRRMLHPDGYAEVEVPDYNNNYASDCDDLFKPPLICWISGHTHECGEIEINGIPSVVNCFGYPTQKTAVDLKKYINIQ